MTADMEIGRDKISQGTRGMMYDADDNLLVSVALTQETILSPNSHFSMRTSAGCGWIHFEG